MYIFLEKEDQFSGTYDNNDVKKEFDRNTAEYFTGQKRKMGDRSVTNGKDMSSEEDEELQKKRMKIEYIKKLLPSSFGNVNQFCNTHYNLIILIYIFLYV